MIFCYHEFFHVILKVISLWKLTLNNNNAPSIFFISQTEHLIWHEGLNFFDIIPQN
jgi:hypothetical protein